MSFCTLIFRLKIEEQHLLSDGVCVIIIIIIVARPIKHVKSNKTQVYEKVQHHWAY